MLLRHCCRFRQHNVADFGNNVAGFGNNFERNFVLLTKSKKLNMFDLFQLCRKDEIKKIGSTLLAKLATLLPKTAAMSKQHSTLSKKSFSL